jgi:hypothetical protein
MLNPKKTPLWISYFVLTTLSAMSFIFYFKAPSESKWDWVRNITVNLGTGIIVALLTALLIDAIINRKQERERKRYELVGLQQLRIPLLHQFQLLFNIFKASVEIKPQNIYQNLRDLFDEDYFVQLAFFDFSKPAPIATPLQWFDYLSHECTKFRDALNRTVEKYSIYLDSETLDVIEQLINSSFISFILQAPAVREVDKRGGFSRDYNFFAGSGMGDIVREYTSLFLKLMEYYNEQVAQENKIVFKDDLWRNDVAPQFGSARINR